MKILIITQYFWPENFKINDLVVGFRDRNHEVTVLTAKPNYPEGKFYKGYNFYNKRLEYYHGCKVIRTPIITRGNGKGIRLFLNYISFALFGSLAAVFRLRKDHDVIMVFGLSPITLGIPAMVYRRLTRVPMFYWVLDLWPESLVAASNINSNFIYKNVERIVRYIYERSDVIFISSKYFRKSIVEKGISDYKIFYLPNWAEDIYLQNYDRNKQVYDLMPENGFKIVFAGNIGEAQDFESVLKAVQLTENIPWICWIIIGDGRKKIWLEERIKELGLKNIRLLGRYPSGLMPYFLREADALLVSLKNEPVFSLTVPAKIQSYLASGRPILGMLNGEGAQIINESGAGFAVPAGEYEKLTKRVVEMSLMSEDNLNKLAKSGKMYYELNFNRNRLIDMIINHFNKVIASRSMN